MKIISIINLKGGVAKTLTADNMAHVLAVFHRMSVDRAALQLKNLLEYCMGKGESFDHSRDWTADVHALYIALEAMEGRADE